jgi:hypothetical protein
MSRSAILHQSSAESDEIPLALKKLGDVNCDSDFIFKLGLWESTCHTLNGIAAARPLENTNGRGVFD